MKGTGSIRDMDAKFVDDAKITKPPVKFRTAVRVRWPQSYSGLTSRRLLHRGCLGWGFDGVFQGGQSKGVVEGLGWAYGWFLLAHRDG